MTVAAFVGQLLLAVSPALALFVLGVTRDHRLTILSIGGAFFWMLSSLLASAWWYAIGPMQATPWFTLIWSVLFQELIRMGFVFLVFWMERRLTATTGRKEMPHIVLNAMAVGTGAALAYVMVVVVPVLIEGIGPGTLFASACPEVSLFTLAAIHATLFSALHVLLSIVAFLAYKRRNWLLIVIVWLCHYAASFFTLLNRPEGHCVGSLCAVLVVVLFSAVLVAICLRKFRLVARKGAPGI